MQLYFSQCMCQVFAGGGDINAGVLQFKKEPAVRLTPLVYEFRKLFCRIIEEIFFESHKIKNIYCSVFIYVCIFSLGISILRLCM